MNFEYDHKLLTLHHRLVVCYPCQVLGVYIEEEAVRKFGVWKRWKLED